MNRLGLSIGALFLAAILLYLPTWMDENEELKTEPGNDALVPTYQARNLTTKLYDESGDLTHQVFATGMQHFELLGFVLFDQPQYTLYPRGGQPQWRLNAKQGTLYDNELIQLEYNVEIINLNPNDFVSRVDTSFIEVRLNEESMQSDKPVIISGKNYTITSNGFTGDLHTQYYELQKHVQTIYAPAAQQ